MASVLLKHVLNITDIMRYHSLLGTRSRVGVGLPKMIFR